MAGASSVAQLADQLRERLAANTIGGRVDDETKWKSHEYEVRAAQDAWQRVGYVPESVAAPLAARFQRAVQRFYGRRRAGRRRRRPRRADESRGARRAPRRVPPDVGIVRSAPG